MLGVPKHLDRIQEVLGICYIKAIQLAQKRAMNTHEVYRPVRINNNLWCDCSQAVQRHPCTTSTPTLHQNTFLYSYEQDLMLPGTSHLAFQGYPSNISLEMFGECETTQGPVARALAGESWSLPCGAQALISALLSAQAPWWH